MVSAYSQILSGNKDNTIYLIIFEGKPAIVDVSGYSVAVAFTKEKDADLFVTGDFIEDVRLDQGDLEFDELTVWEFFYLLSEWKKEGLDILSFDGGVLPLCEDSEEFLGSVLGKEEKSFDC